MHVLHAVEELGDPVHDAARVLLRRAQFPARESRAVLAEVGAAPDRARPRSAGRLAHPARGRHQCGAQGEGRVAARRRPPRGARQPARQPGRGDGARQYRRVPRPRRRRPPARAEQAARTVAAARRAAQRHRTAHRRRRRCRRRPDPAYAHRAGDRRAHPPVGRAVDPDRRAARQRAWHRRAVDPAPGRRPHAGAGAGPAGSVAAEGIARQDRQADVPHGRPVDAGRPGAARRQGAAGIRNPATARKPKDSRPI